MALRDSRPVWSLGLFFFLLLSLLLGNLPVSHGQTPCSLCSHGPDETPVPDKKINTEGETANTCGFLQSSAPFLEVGSPFCDGIRAAGTTCECNIPPNGCRLCWDGSRVTLPQKFLEDYRAQEFIPISPLDEMMNCDAIESFFHTVDKNDPRCAIVQQDAGERCGCPPFPGSDNSDNNSNLGSNNNNSNNSTNAANNETDTGGTTTNNGGEDEEEEDEDSEPETVRASCTICRDGSAPTRPEREIELGDLPISNCMDVELFANLVIVGTDECNGLQAIGPYCGCPRMENACTFCPHGEPVPNGDLSLNWFSSFVQTVPQAYRSVADSLTCELYESIVASNSAALFSLEPAMFCLASQLKSWICGCRPDWRQFMLTWCYRLSGLLSLLVSTTTAAAIVQFLVLVLRTSLILKYVFFKSQGSSLIIADVFRKRRNRFTMYHQLVLGISFFDCISSIAYLMVGVMAPYEAGFYLSRGNETTCLIQAAMIQLGQSSMYYNMCLALYFLCVITFNWKEHQFRKLQIWLHVGVVAVGVTLTVLSMPYVGAQFGVCGLLQPPATATFWPVVLFYTAPVSVVLLTLTLVTILICNKVYRQQRRAKKWMFDPNMTLTRKVFWQSFWYVMAFYLTLPFLLLSYYMRFETSQHFGIFVLVAVFAPSQGLMNSLVYFHRSRGIAMFEFLFCCCWGFIYKPKTSDSELEETSATTDRSRTNAETRSRFTEPRETVDTDASAAEKDSDKSPEDENDVFVKEIGEDGSSSSSSNEAQPSDDDGSKKIGSDASSRSKRSSLVRGMTKRLTFLVNDDDDRSEHGSEPEPYRDEPRSRALARQDSQASFSAVAEHWRLNEMTDSEGASEEFAPNNNNNNNDGPAEESLRRHASSTEGFRPFQSFKQATAHLLRSPTFRHRETRNVRAPSRSSMAIHGTNGLPRHALPQRSLSVEGVILERSDEHAVVAP